MRDHIIIVGQGHKTYYGMDNPGNWKKSWAWAGAIKNEKGEVLEYSTSKYDVIAIAMANGS